MLFDRVFIWYFINFDYHRKHHQPGCLYQRKFSRRQQKVWKTLCIDFYISNFDEYTKLFIWSCKILLLVDFISIHAKYRLIKLSLVVFW